MLIQQQKEENLSLLLNKVFSHLYNFNKKKYLIYTVNNKHTMYVAFSICSTVIFLLLFLITYCFTCIQSISVFCDLDIGDIILYTFLWHQTFKSINSIKILFKAKSVISLLWNKMTRIVILVISPTPSSSYHYSIYHSLCTHFQMTKTLKLNKATFNIYKSFLSHFNLLYKLHLCSLSCYINSNSKALRTY